MSQTTHDLSGPRILLFYPSDSLVQQVNGWASKHEHGAVESCFGRLRPQIHAAIQAADGVLVDATADEAQAMEAFCQAVTCLGSAATTVYTERMHAGLELFVRTRGALLLLGPLDDADWESFFRRAIPGSDGQRSWRLVA
ncbi:MAG: hypothetical protein ABSG68_21760 [Thermoguttaceae bacterium]